MEDARLFVYGSLMSGLSAADMLAGAERLGPARTVDAFALVVLGRYPGLVAGAASIQGELYRAPDTIWPRLDRYEGAPDLYTRREIELAGGDRAQAYLLNARFIARAERIDALDWRVFTGRASR